MRDIQQFLFGVKRLNANIVHTPVVITALVAVIHGGARVTYQDTATPVEPWITATSAVMTIFDGFGLGWKSPMPQLESSGNSPVIPRQFKERE